MSPEIQNILNRIAANIQEDAVAQVREHLLGEPPPANLRARLDALIETLRDQYRAAFTQKVVTAICGPDATLAAPKSKAAPKKALGFQHPYGFKKDGTPKKKPGAKAKVQGPTGPIQVGIAWFEADRRFVVELPDGRQYRGTRERDLARRLRQMGFEPISSPF
jgi:hypothetical protein